jgi:hypothetical protein
MVYYKIARITFAICGISTPYKQSNALASMNSVFLNEFTIFARRFSLSTLSKRLMISYIAELQQML